MIVLYGSGAGVTEIFGDAVGEDEWSRLRRSAIRLLNARGGKEAASIVQNFPFELRDGTNYFRDEFSVLYAVVPIEQYIEFEELKGTSRSLFRQIAETISEIGPFTRFVVAELEEADERTPVSPPSPRVTGESVEAALSDAEQLLRASSPASALDRVHTALHGYLRILLDRAEIEHDPKAPVTRLFKLIRERHPAMRDLGERSEDVWRIVMGMASVIDALNVLRNNASIAHPNERLLEAAEAMLAINSGRTLFHYIDSKVEP